VVAGLKSADPDRAVITAAAADPELWPDFAALCDLGGRFAGTTGERAALDLLKSRGTAATGCPVRSIPVAYGGWRTTGCRLELLANNSITVPCHPLVRSVATPPEGLDAEVLDLGRGTLEQFAAHADEIPGRIVLVRHEYMFAASHLHRRRKYAWAMEHGAAGFMIASPLAGERPVAGSCGRDGPEGIPAIGISFETAARLASGSGQSRVRLFLATKEHAAASETLVFDVPGRSEDRVVLSAHLDGHDLAESAIDNATGVAVALTIARAVAPHVAAFRRGLSLCLFSVEEWGLTGSRLYVQGLAPAERDRIALDVNLDSVGGSTRLTTLTSDFPRLDAFVRQVADRAGLPIGVHRPLMSNSDHANFAAAGIPALRLVAGFDDPASNLRYVLTPADTRDKVSAAELARAARIGAALVVAACRASDETMRRLRERDSPKAS
jgi:aminopeptidase YwaD